MDNSLPVQFLTLFTAQESLTSASNYLKQTTDGLNLYSNRTAITLQIAGLRSLHNSTEDVHGTWV